MWSPSAGRRFCRVQSRYAYPAGAYFCMRASSRAALHIGLLSLWDRQPSNAPPLLLSPAGLASRRGPHTKTRLGLRPKTPTRRSPPARKAKATASRRIGAPGGTQGPLGKGGRTEAGRAARSAAKGQHDSSGGCVRRDDAYKVSQTHFM